MINKKNKNFETIFFKFFIIFLLILSLLFFLGSFFFIGEIIARIFLSGMTTNAGAGPAFIDFYKNYVHLNSDKLRDREYPIEKGNNTIRIAGLGDSSTFGFGVKNIS